MSTTSTLKQGLLVGLVICVLAALTVPMATRTRDRRSARRQMRNRHVEP